MSKYMRYEDVSVRNLRPLSIKRSTTISKMTTGQIFKHLYKRHEILILQVLVALVFTWAIINKLG